jgi:glyoxylase-like metal-dependent hydrolase (beta-lactamase superfamily II)
MENNNKNLYFNVARQVWGMKDIFVNIYMIQNDDEKSWVLVDTGLKTSEKKIKRMAASLFGQTVNQNVLCLRMDILIMLVR